MPLVPRVKTITHQYQAYGVIILNIKQDNPSESKDSMWNSFDYWE
jgi:hypothetical protein